MALLYMTATFPENPEGDAVFHLFSELPAGLRNKVWTHYLADATPQMYRFILRYPRRLLKGSGDNHTQANDQLFLRPVGCITRPREQDFL
jgi:hypothetical protein